MNSEVLQFLRGKLAEAETSLRAREQMENTWRSGTDESWAQSSLLHPKTAAEPPIKRAERLKNAEAQKRIAAKCRREVEMFKAVIAALESEAG